MTRQGVEAVNGRQVADALGDLGRAAADMSAPTRTVLSVGLDAARGAAPRRTGELVGGLDVIDVSATGGTLAASAPYSRYQEYGTRYVKARRFMAAGSEAIRAAAGDAYRDDLSDKVNKAAAKA